MKKIYILCLILIAVFSINAVFGENFTDLNEKINENEIVVLNDDIILNQNASNEENTFKEGISISDRQINIDGNNHSIFAKDSNLNQVRLFNITNSNVTISNIVISSASFNGAGGAIIIDANSTLILKDVTFKDNTALGLYGEGGAIYSSGTLFIYNSTFENNYASGAGGALFSLARNSTISSSKFINNSAKWYGGAIHSCSNIFLDSSLFDSNSAYSGSAFHYAVSSLSLEYDNNEAFLTSSVFRNNKADFGGAISTASLRRIITADCRFVNNQALKGGVIYKCGMTDTFLHNCSIENNTAEIGAAFFDDSFEGVFEDEEQNHTSFITLSDCSLKNNIASDMASVFYARASNFWVNNTVFDNNSNREIINGLGNITVINSRISNYREDFITQFINGTVIFINNTFSIKNVNIILLNNSSQINDEDFDRIFNISDDTNIIVDIDYNGTIIDYNDYRYDKISHACIWEMRESECCSVYVRLNSTDYALSQRRDGSKANFTVYVDKTDNYIKEFKAISEYYLLSKTYTNGWVIGCGGWDESSENEKVEALASDMAIKGQIDEEALKLILETKKRCGVGHLLIVAPNGSYGNVVTFKGKDIFKMGVLNDGDYIVSPNGVENWRYGHIDNISDVVTENIFLSSNDTYGIRRHCILVHHVKLDENGFSDSVHVSNEDGSLINQTNYLHADSFWFKEEFTHHSEIPLSLDNKYLGTYYDYNKTIFSENANINYNGDYTFKAKFINRDGDLLVNETVQAIVNGKSNEYVTNNEGIIEIAFQKLTSNQTITLTNPVTGETAENTITVMSKNQHDPKKREDQNSNKSPEIRTFRLNEESYKANEGLYKYTKDSYKASEDSYKAQPTSNNTTKSINPDILNKLKIILKMILKNLLGIFNLDFLIPGFNKLMQIIDWMIGVFHPNIQI